MTVEPTQSSPTSPMNGSPRPVLTRSNAALNLGADLTPSPKPKSSPVHRALKRPSATATMKRPSKGAMKRPASKGANPKKTKGPKIVEDIESDEASDSEDSSTTRADRRMGQLENDWIDWRDYNASYKEGLDVTKASDIKSGMLRHGYVKVGRSWKKNDEQGEKGDGAAASSSSKSKRGRRN